MKKNHVYKLMKMGIISRLANIVIGILFSGGLIFGQYIDYPEIKDPALKSSMESMRAHQIQYTMYMFYSMNIDTPGFVETGGYNRRMKDTGEIRMQPYYRWRAGPVIETNKPLDFLIDADNRGFFTVLLPGNQIGYTRDGRFKIDSKGRLVMVDGNYPVVGTNGPIVLPEEADFAVSKSGAIFADGDILDRFDIKVFTNSGRDRLITINGSVFVSTEGVPEQLIGEEHYAVRQGMIEQNNVMKAIVGDVTMLKRAYEGISKVAKVTTRAMGSAIQIASP